MFNNKVMCPHEQNSLMRASVKQSIIVSDATPIIAFSRINELDLFRQIVGEITIPQEVSKELYEHRRTVASLNSIYSLHPILSIL